MMSHTAAKQELEKLITDATECSICHDTFDKPKLLPCVHTFCLHCIEQWADIDGKLPGDAVSCPMCRKELVIPDAGLSALPGNIYVETLIGVYQIARKMAKPEADDGGNRLDEATGDVERQLCREHRKRLDIFCVDCRLPICSTCCVSDLHHRGHDCCDLLEKCVTLRQQLEADLIGVKRRTLVCKENMKELDDKSREFVDHVCRAQQEINRRAGQLSEDIEKQKAELMEKLSIVKESKGKEVDSRKNEIDRSMVMLNGFIQHCENMMKTELASDLARHFDALHNTAIELQKAQPTACTAPFSPVVRFTPLDLQTRTNLIGDVVIIEGDGAAKSKQRMEELLQPESNLEVERKSEEIAGQLGNELNSKIRQLEMRLQAAVQAECQLRREVQEAGSETARLKAELNKERDQNSRLLGKLKQTEEDSKKVLAKVTSYFEKTHEGPRNAEAVYGMALIKDELFVKRAWTPDIEVYDMTSYTVKRQILIPALNKKDVCDMTACERNGCLYIAECTDSRIHRIDGEGRVAVNWKADSLPRGVSVTDSATLLVVCKKTPKLCEFTTDGHLLKEIHLESSMSEPNHAIRLNSGLFLVSHGQVHAASRRPELVYRVCLVGEDGRVAKAYDGLRGCVGGHMYEPRHMAVDEDGFIYVVDTYNTRVILLSSGLEFVRELVGPSTKDMWGYPCRLLLDRRHDRLYVAENRMVNVFTLYLNGHFMVFKTK